MSIGFSGLGDTAREADSHGRGQKAMSESM